MTDLVKDLSLLDDAIQGFVVPGGADGPLSRVRAFIMSNLDTNEASKDLIQNADKFDNCSVNQDGSVSRNAVHLVDAYGKAILSYNKKIETHPGKTKQEWDELVSLRKALISAFQIALDKIPVKVPVHNEAGLLPCYCGGNPEYDNSDSGSGKWYGCDKCGIKVFAHYGFLDEDLRSAWNRQATRQPISLTFSSLRQANIARLPEFKDANGRPAHESEDGSDWSPAQWLQAVIGELGEYANIRKKFERGDLELEEFKELAWKELADVQCYLDILARRCLDTSEETHPTGVDLGQSVIDKFNLISERVKSSVRLSAKGWYRETDGK